ncbi:MAG: hypothetical protein WCK00_11815, partial [Deltaproteobacteria bacterium]
NSEVRILDIDPKAGDLITRLLRKMAATSHSSMRIEFTSDQKAALKGADFVITTISTGGEHCFENDMKIPEKYGIFQTVADSVGPGGWSRSIRGAPVFLNLANDLNRIAPDAMLINYTNPMGSLTSILAQTCRCPSVGLCHGLFEVYSLLQHIFEAKSESEIVVKIAGLNHFFWLLDFTVRGESGYPLLRRLIKKAGSLPNLVDDGYRYDIRPTSRDYGRMVKKSLGPSNEYYLADELFQRFGLLPYTGDRHTSEFLSNYLTPTPEKLERFRLRRTPISQRHEDRKILEGKIKEMVSGKRPLPSERTREATADIISARISGRHIIDVVNLPNIGQVDNLPRGAVVETLGVIGATGFAPITAGALPEQIADIIRPHARNQMMVVEASIKGDRSMAMEALLNEPLCSHLSVKEIRKMGDELLLATAKAGVELPF